MPCPPGRWTDLEAGADDDDDDDDDDVDDRLAHAYTSRTIPVMTIHT